MSTPAPENLSRRQQIVQSYRMAKKHDPRLGLWILLAAVVGGVVGYVVVSLLPGGGALSVILSVVTALLTALLAATIVFGRRVQKAAYKQMDGQVGAAAAALSMLKRGWKVEPAIGFNKQQDIVHRVIGPPGIVLVGEGKDHNRVTKLLAVERRNHERVLAETPIHEVICGDGEGEVPLPRIVKHVTKLGRQVKPAEMTDILNRMKALNVHRSNIPLPKGPVPTSMKGMRSQQRGR